MLEAIAIKLVTVLTGFLFEMGLKSADRIQIENAPTWYYEETNPDYIYVFSFKKGGIETIEPLEAELELKMQKKINTIILTITYENFKNVKDTLEKELIEKFKNDENLYLFVKKNIQINRIKHQKKQKKGFIKKARQEITFGSAILSKKELINYQQMRIENLRKEIELKKSKRAYDKLDKEIQSDDLEKELDGEIPIF